MVPPGGPLAVVAFLIAVACATSSKESPVEKVITLLEDLEAEVQDEGKTEAATYDTYACFCKDTTKDKSDAILNGQDTIDGLSASISEDTATQAEKGTELEKKQKQVEEVTAELETTTAQCLKEAAEFQAEMADLSKACSSLDKALTAMKASKPSLLELFHSANNTLRAEVESTLALADALSLVDAPKGRAVAAFMQGQRDDPNDKEYKYHSDTIITMLENLHKDFNAKKTEVDEEFKKAKKVCDDTKEELTGQLDESQLEIASLETDINDLKEKISGDRTSLVQAEDMLKDDKIYLTDLTAQCESSAKQWDQRSKSRAEELQVLAEALTILKEGKDGGTSVTDLDEMTRQREEAAAVELAQLPGHAQGMGRQSQQKEDGAGRSAFTVTEEKALVPSFLQQEGSRSVSLRKASINVRKAEQLLRETGINIKSAALSAMASKIASDPFGKVKTLIQELIERLLDEARKEATKQGFCDTELGKAYQARDTRLMDAKKLAAEIGMLTSKNATLSQDIEELQEALPELYDTLNQTTDLRAQEKEENLERITHAKQGLSSITKAIVTLKTYYKQSSKALLQQTASPVDEATSGPGFAGSYQGKQEGAKGVIGLLEVIKADFDRTIRQTTVEEKQAQEEFVGFEQTSKADIASKEMSLQLKSEDKAKTISSIEKSLSELKIAQGLLDDALKTVEDLKPMCLDMGMDYETRVAKREEEIAALKKALTYLEPPAA